MKKEIIKITKDLEQCKITENEARTVLLGLLGVSECFTLQNIIEAANYYQGDYDIDENNITEFFEDKLNGINTSNIR
jgi:hypothetical protein